MRLTLAMMSIIKYYNQSQQLQKITAFFLKKIVPISVLNLEAGIGVIGIVDGIGSEFRNNAHSFLLQKRIHL